MSMSAMLSRSMVVRRLALHANCICEITMTAIKPLSFWTTGCETLIHKGIFPPIQKSPVRRLKMRSHNNFHEYKNVILKMPKFCTSIGRWQPTNILHWWILDRHLQAHLIQYYRSARSAMYSCIWYSKSKFINSVVLLFTKTR